MNRYHLLLCSALLLPCSTLPAQEMSDRDFAARIQTQVTWSEFPHADRAVERVPDQFNSARHMRAKVESCQSTSTPFLLTFRLGLSPDGNWSNIQFTGPLVTFRINRRLPIPPNEIVGKEISLQYDQRGELLSINLLGIGVTHVRKSVNSEKREVKTVIEGDGLFPLFDVNATDQQRRNALTQATSFSFLPDKLALLDNDSEELLFFRVLQLARDYGVVVQTFDGAPGMLELESFELEAPPSPNPWIPVGKWSSWGPLPAQQRTFNLQ